MLAHWEFLLAPGCHEISRRNLMEKTCRRVKIRPYRVCNKNRVRIGGPQAHFFIGLDQTQKIATLIEPTMTDMGYELVRVMTTGGRRPTLQIMAERIDRAGMNVDDCAEISRAISAILDVDDPISGAYELEVSSPGIDRPLMKPADFERFAGFEARVETDLAIDGQRKFKGQLLGLQDQAVRLALPEGEKEIPLTAIRKAKLVLTDDLIAAAEAEGRN